MAANYTGSAVKQLEQQMKILRLEKELERARKSMLTDRKNEYQNTLRGGSGATLRGTNSGALKGSSGSTLKK